MPNQICNFESSLKEWRKALGSDAVIVDDSSLRAAEKTTFPTDAKISAILLPSSTAEVQECLRIASQFDIVIYPISSGRNWGYGSKVPPLGKAVLMDLGRMNRILSFDEDLAYVTIEPGVSQRQLHQFLSEKTNGRLWMDATAASPLSSVIGNIMERGHGLTPACDHVGQVAGFEVVLPNGEKFNTGYGAFKGNNLGPIDQWGLGPALQGLFTQSNLGVVTQASVWLLPAPEKTVICTFAFSTAEKMHLAVESLRPLRLSGVLKSGPQFYNQYFALSRNMKFPWDLTQETPLKIETCTMLAAEKGIRPWNGIAILYGTEPEVKEGQRRIESALNGITESLHFLEQSSEVSKSDLASVFSQATGGLGGVGLPRAYWRMRTPVPDHVEEIDLDRDECGVVAICVTAPFTAEDVVRVTEIKRDTILEFGFEPNIAFLATRSRTLQFHTFICYDRKNANDEARILLCQKAVQTRLQNDGYLPHRLGLFSMDVMESMDDVHAKLLKQIKQLVDPKNILAPGRYMPR